MVQAVAAPLAEPLQNSCTSKQYLARSRDELTAAFKLVFESYFQAGLVGHKLSGLRLTPHHMLPTSEVLIAKTDNTITSTVSLFADGYLGLPMESMYTREIADLRREGCRVAEIGCLADRRESQARFIDTFVKLGQLLGQVAVKRGLNGLVAAVHPRHARLYKRIMGFRQFGELTECPYANGNPAVALVLKFDEHADTQLAAKFLGERIPDAELMPYHWDRETRRHFQQILERDNRVATSGGIQGYYNWAASTGAIIS